MFCPVVGPWDGKGWIRRIVTCETWRAVSKDILIQGVMHWKSEGSWRPRVFGYQQTWADAWSAGSWRPVLGLSLGGWPWVEQKPFKGSLWGSYGCCAESKGAWDLALGGEIHRLVFSRVCESISFWIPPLSFIGSPEKNHMDAQTLEKDMRYVSRDEWGSWLAQNCGQDLVCPLSSSLSPLFSPSLKCTYITCLDLHYHNLILIFFKF